MKVLDLFSGIGGFTLGLDRAGFETVAFCEIDKHCHKVLKKHWPKIPIFEDVKTLCQFDFEEGEIDVICGGFPCQDISIGGRQKGIHKGDRSGLWKEYRRLIDGIRPKFVLIENVERLRKNGLGIVLRDLHEIGYDCEWHCITARSIGLPHQRDRIWVIAHPRRKRLNECTGEERHLQVDEKRKNPQAYTDGEERELEPVPFRAILSRGALEACYNSNSEQRSIISKLRRVTNGFSSKLDERRRKQRIKQLGNAVVPQIPQLIGEAIIQYEKEKSK